MRQLMGVDGRVVGVLAVHLQGGQGADEIGAVFKNAQPGRFSSLFVQLRPQPFL